MNSHFNIDYQHLQELIISEDSYALNQYNKNKKNDSKFILREEIKPCPYEGSIEDARVILLLANPGFTPKDNDDKSYSKCTDHVRDCRHKNWGIFSLHGDSNPAMREWWTGNLSKIKEDTNLSWQLISSRFAALQINPWASEQFDAAAILPSMRENETMHKIARSFIEKENVIFIICRRKLQWKNILSKYNDKMHPVYELNSFRRAYITPGNLSKSTGAYEHICNRLME